MDNPIIYETKPLSLLSIARSVGWKHVFFPEPCLLPRMDRVSRRKMIWSLRRVSFMRAVPSGIITGLYMFDGLPERIRTYSQLPSNIMETSVFMSVMSGLCVFTLVAMFLRMFRTKMPFASVVRSTGNPDLDRFLSQDCFLLAEKATAADLSMQEQVDLGRLCEVLSSTGLSDTSRQAFEARAILLASRMDEMVRITHEAPAPAFLHVLDSLEHLGVRK